MEITIVTSSFPQVSETFIINHAVSLIKQGHKVNIISFFKPQQQIVHGIYTDFHFNKITHYENEQTTTVFVRYFVYLKNSIKFFLSSPIGFLNLFLNNKIKSKHTYFSTYKHKKIYNQSNIIHAHFGPAGKRITDLKGIGFIKSNIPIVCSFHGYDIDSPQFYGNASYYQSLFKSAALFFSNSIYLKNKLIDTGCSEQKIRVVKIGIDSNMFKRIDQKTDDKLKIITVARLVEVKGISYAINAIKLLVDKGYRDIIYTIIGEGEQRKELEILIKKLKIEAHVKLLGAKSQEDIIKYYTNSDVFVLSSIVSTEGRAEAQGLVIQEAQSMELPVIVTNVGGIAEGILPNVTGFLVPEKSAEGIAEKIEYVIHNAQASIKMGKVGREFVKTKFELQVTGQQTLKYYNDLLNANN